ncbi:hemolysin family protein [Rubrobacter indicoceani]|uniref:hemolysin family protein n=1 Tax=Rubrobacter indicoceani TaxID=2051957 RepID=UPI000E5B356F|nr:hemolysin family protein [Rubrobacter indicoceani]
MPALIPVLAVVAFLVSVNALYVAAEFAAVGSRRARVREQAESGDRMATRLLPVLEDRSQLDRYIAACQIGITLSSIIVGFYGQAQFTPVVSPLLAALGLPEATATTISTVGLLVGLTSVQVVLGELLPKSLAIRYPERIALATMLPMSWSLTVLRPFIYFLNGSGLFLMRVMGLRNESEHGHVHSSQELEMLFRESAQGGLINAEEREMLENVLHLEERVARQVMVPRNRLVAEPLDAPAGELLGRLATSPHTRFPIYEGNTDSIVGIVHLRELYLFAGRNPDGDIREILREVPMVPESMSVRELWRTMGEHRSYVAVIFDEHGGTAGIATVEDVIEEVFGEVRDEFDLEELDIISEDGGGRTRMRGDLLVPVANGRLLLDLPDREADTVGGLVLDRIGKTPEVGDEVAVGGSKLRVESVREGWVEEISVLRADRPPSVAPGGGG